jgi:hypothetical protein
MTRKYYLRNYSTKKWESNNFLQLKAQFNTIAKALGLEANTELIRDLNSGTYLVEIGALKLALQVEDENRERNESLQPIRLA